MKTEFAEFDYFSFEDTVETNIFPYTKTYSGNIRELAQVSFIYEDMSTDTFTEYSSVLQIFKNNKIIEEWEFFVQSTGEKMHYSFTTD